MFCKRQPTEHSSFPSSSLKHPAKLLTRNITSGTATSRQYESAITQKIFEKFVTLLQVSQVLNAGRRHPCHALCQPTLRVCGYFHALRIQFRTFPEKIIIAPLAGQKRRYIKDEREVRYHCLTTNALLPSLPNVMRITKNGSMLNFSSRRAA
ncbi:hypothetical protein D3C76_1223170 [compost metagenome]